MVRRSLERRQTPPKASEFNAIGKPRELPEIYYGLSSSQNHCLSCKMLVCILNLQKIYELQSVTKFFIQMAQ